MLPANNMHKTHLLFNTFISPALITAECNIYPAFASSISCSVGADDTISVALGISNQEITSGLNILQRGWDKRLSTLAWHKEFFVANQCQQAWYSANAWWPERKAMLWHCFAFRPLKHFWTSDLYSSTLGCPNVKRCPGHCIAFQPLNAFGLRFQLEAHKKFH